MLRAVLFFLLGMLALVVVLYVVSLVMPMLMLPAPIAAISQLFIGLLGLCFIIWLCYNIFRSSPPGGPGPLV